MNIVASSPEGLENYLAKEIINLGGENIKRRKRSVSFQCDYESFYKIHFYSRIAFRFYREIACFNCSNKDNLYRGVQSSFDWLKWLPSNKSFCVHVTGKNASLNHSHYSALQVKNSIVDLQNSVLGKRSSISIENPFLIIHLHLNDGKAILSLQSTSESLHKRGYRPAVGNAPLKENLAAGLIQITQWDSNRPLVDLMCGSGTFLIEAASQSLKMPLPLKSNYLFENWFDFEKDLFERIKLNLVRKSSNGNKLFKLNGYEINHDVFIQAKGNIKLAGLSEFIEIHNIDFSKIKINSNKGIILCNPPYGKKLIKDQNELINLYTKIGNCVKEKFSGWELWLLSGNPELTRYLKMKSSLKVPVSNGGIDCRWIKYDIR